METSRQWSATAGLSKSQFKELVLLFRKAYIGIYGMELQIRQEESSQESHLKTYEDFLFFVLFSLKSVLTYDALGFVFGMSGGTAKKKQELGLKLLEVALESIGVMPKRFVESVAEFEELMADQYTLIVDGTEQDIQRPRDENKKKSDYSGKKRHTVKSILISNTYKVVLYLSKPYVGKAHDYGILKEEFVPRKNWFKDHKVQLDLGFYGFKDLYKCKELEIPHKKPKNEELNG